MPTVSSTTKALLRWYDEHHRPLPWRSCTDPYPIWLIEVILQQTRVDQGLAYWERFIRRYPTVHELAAASEHDVLKLWQGLGYYSRARNLLAAARQVAGEHNGHFPRQPALLRTLKGVGEYTAAAIASIAFGEPVAVVDGNVFRVLSRLYDIPTPIDSTAGRKEFRELAQRMLDTSRPGDHNQAMMELGATVCTPKAPACNTCPLAPDCLALHHGSIGQRPVKSGRAAVRTRHFNYLHVEHDGHLYMAHRKGRDIWQGLHELPLVETSGPVGTQELQRLLQETVKSSFHMQGRSSVLSHVLSHQRIQAVFWQVAPRRNWKAPDHWLRIPLERVPEYAVPRLIERWMQGEAPYTRS